MRLLTILIPIATMLGVLVSPVIYGQTTIVNYDFNSAASYNTLSPVTAAGVTSTASSTEPLQTYTGTSTGSSAFTANNTPGLAIGMTNSSGTDTKYFQFSLSGSNLVNYSAYRLYFQSYRPSTGANTLTLAYSTDGGGVFTNAAVLVNPAISTFTEHVADLSGQTALNGKSAIVFRLLISGATGSGPLRLDNFQVRATSALNPTPTIASLNPTSIAAGSNGLTLTITGTGFLPSSVVRFNGANRVTTFVSATQLSAAIPATDVASMGTYPVEVTTPAPGGGSSNSINFTVTPVLRWDGGAGTNSWFDALNWDTDVVPTANDDVLLDHATVAGRYTVLLVPSGSPTPASPTVEVRSLTVNPAAGDSILFEIPANNTNALPLRLTRTSGTEIALAIQNKGVVTNNSDVGGIDIPGDNPVFYLYNGGTYRHYTDRPHAPLVENLAPAPGTEAGTWEFRAKLQASGTPSIAGRTYPNLVFRNRPGFATTSYGGSGSNPLTVRGNLIIGPGVTFAPDLNSEIRLAGNLVVQGNFRFQPSQVTAPKLVFNGTAAQRISGTALGATTGTSYLGASVGLQINNTSTEGVTLATPVTVNNVLQLTMGKLTTDAINVITLLNQPTEGSDNSFVNGPVARVANGPATLVFPLGRTDAQGSAFRPLTLAISSLSRATTFVATQTEGSFASQQLGSGLQRINRTRYFTLTAAPALSSAESFAALVTLSFGTDDQVTNPEASTLVIARHTGTEWVNAGRSSSTGTASNGASVAGTLTSGAVTALGSFTLGSTDASGTQNPLPVTLVSFSAERNAKGVHLNWTTGAELGNHKFEVQRSLDGRQFAAVATLAGQGTSITSHTYSWLDAAVPNRTLYYRLRQQDTDGTNSFSTVLLVRAEAQPPLLVYPNPVHQHLTFQAPSLNKAYRVVNTSGQVLLRGQTVTGTNRVNVQRLPPAVYYLLLDSEAGTESSRFQKK